MGFLRGVETGKYLHGLAGEPKIKTVASVNCRLSIELQLKEHLQELFPWGCSWVLVKTSCCRFCSTGSGAAKPPGYLHAKKKENPAKIVLLTQFWPSCSECTAEVSPLTELASCFTSAKRRALMTRERLYLYKFDSVWKWKRCKHLLGKQNFRKQRWSFCPLLYLGRGEMYRWKALVMSHTSVFSSGLSFTPQNTAAGPGEMWSCKREEEQNANHIPKSAVRSVWSCEQWSLFGAGWVKGRYRL